MKLVLPFTTKKVATFTPEGRTGFLACPYCQQKVTPAGRPNLSQISESAGKYWEQMQAEVDWQCLHCRRHFTLPDNPFPIATQEVSA